jgi:hypothetical protein
VVAPVARRSTLTFAVPLVLLAAGLVLQSAVAAGSVQIVPPRTFAIAVWTSATDNLVPLNGKVTANGSPVAGVRLRVDNYDLPKPTNAQGQFTYLADGTLLARHVVVVTDAKEAKSGGQPLSSEEQKALLATESAINVAYTPRDLKVTTDAAGRPVITGRLTKTNGTPPPAVGLLTYQLTGTVTDSNGKPVSGIQVSTRTQDRDYWTISTLTDSKGRYNSLFTASAEELTDPVPFTVRLSKGDLVYQYLLQEVVYFPRLKSAKMDIRLPPKGYALALPIPRSYPGALYSGIAAGVTQGGVPVRPVSATWPDATGRFSITLPKSLAGKTVALWEGKLILYSATEAKPGSAIDLQDWPETLPRDAPRDLASIKLK